MKTFRQRDKEKKILFTNPKKNSVAILYSDDYWIRRLILKNIPATTFGLYPGETTIYLTWELFLRTLSRLLRSKVEVAITPWSIKKLARCVYDNYILACLDQAEAKVVLTFIDNGTIFQRLSVLDKARSYFAIQNGARTLACVRDSLVGYSCPSISMTNLFCFGRREIRLFKSHKHKIKKFYPFGSLIGSYYKFTNGKKQCRLKKYDLCLISQWSPIFFIEKKGEGFAREAGIRTRDGVLGLTDLLARLLKETGLRILICPRGDDYEEIKYYTQKIKQPIYFSQHDRPSFATYRAVEKSKVAIGLNSTVLSEVFAWGQKVLWCNPTSDPHFEMKCAGLCYFEGNNYLAFKRKILNILKMDLSMYKQLTAKRAAYINNFDPREPSHLKIRHMVGQALNNRIGHE